MALTATFEADFTKFYDAVRQADAQLKSFADGAGNVTDRLSRMENAFSGRTVIQQASIMVQAIEDLGGASTLTEKELARVGATMGEAVEKMRALGMDVPKQMQDLADASAHAGEESESLTGSLTKLALSYISIQAALALVSEAYHTFLGFLADSITAASAAEQADAQLTGALVAQGTAIPSVTAAYHDYAAALQATTAYSDDAVTAAEAILVQIGNVMPRDMKAALDATTNLAAGLRIDLASAAQMVAKAAEGQVTSLQRAGVVIQQTGEEGLKFSDVLGAINDRFKGQAELMAGTYQGRLSQLGNTWDNVQESVGRVITTNETLLQALTGINQLVADSTTELNQNAAAENLVSDAVILLVKGLALAVEGVDAMIQAIASYREQVDQGAILTLKLAQTFIELGETVVKVQALVPGIFGEAARSNLAQYESALSGIKGRIGELEQDLTASGATADAWHTNLSHLKDGLDTLGSSLESSRGQVHELTTAQQTNSRAWEDETTAIKQTTGALAEHEAAAARIYKAIAGPESLSAGLTDMIHHWLELGAAQSDVATYFNVSAQAVKAIGDEIAAAAAKAKAHEAALAELATVTQDYHATVAALDQTMVAAIENYLQAGVSQKTLADAYGLTAAQIAAVAKEMQNEQLVAKQAADYRAAMAKLDAEYAKVTVDLSTNKMQAEIANIWAVADAEAAALDKRQQLTVEAYSKIMAIAQAKTDAEIANTYKTDNTTRAYYENLANQAQAAYDNAQAHSDQFTQEGIDHLRELAEQAQATFLTWQDSANAALQGVGTTADQTTQKVKAVTAAMQEASAYPLAGMGGTVSLTAANLPGALAQLGLGGGPINLDVLQAIASGSLSVAKAPAGSAAIQGAQRSADITTAQMILQYLAQHTTSVAVSGARQAGGSVEMGHAYVVGEGGPELFIPGTTGAIGADQGLYTPPAGGGAAGGVVLQPGAVVMNFPIVNDPQAMDQLARIVGDAILAKLTRQGTRVMS